MKFLLDTNIVTKFYDRSADGHVQIRETIATLTESDELAISILTLYELGYGLANAPDEKRKIVFQKFEQVQQDFRLLPLPAKGAEIFGGLKKALRQKRSLHQQAVQKYNVDLLLAATCLAGSWILVTADTVFEDLKVCEPELLVENWLETGS